MSKKPAVLYTVEVRRELGARIFKLEGRVKKLERVCERLEFVGFEPQRIGGPQREDWEKR